MRRAALVMALVLLACGTGTLTKSQPMTVEIANNNWYADTVILYCVGAGPDRAIRGLVMGERRRVRLRRSGCREYAVVVEGLGGLSYRHPAYVLAGPGLLVCIDIAPSIHLTAVWPCGDRTDS